MRCSEASYSVRACSVVVACLLSLAIARADDAPATEHETRKPQHTNQLVNETSPYLLLHAHNPVAWRPWGPEALQAAKDANRPIFLSVGYSSCYWCHVMEREVFENEAIAAYLNEHFICIKVDREERPDIDDQYMLALQLYFQATGSAQGGGWPMSMFLTPDAKPFAGGTYFPAEDKPGQPGFRSILEQIHTLWTTREADLRNNADFLTSTVARYAQPGLALEKVPLDASLVQAATLAVMASYDQAYGGFGVDQDAPEGPKFPSAPMLSLLGYHAYWTSQPDGIDQALDNTLTRMAMGGIRDHLGGGFHRYSVDREWRVPHFEKMLYDQALLIEVYTSAWRRTKNPLYRQVVEETADFVLREMTSPEGGFYSSLDAETDGVEGQYYVWSREEIETILGADDAHVFAATYGFDEPSKFEHGYVLFLPSPLEQTAQALNLSSEELEKRLASMRERLLVARAKRPALLRDEKALTSWNGLMISALAVAGLELDRPDYLKAAENSARFILTEVCDEEGRLLHSYAAGRASIKPFLEDYAYLIRGLLFLAVPFEGIDPVESARKLMDQQFILFWDEGEGGFYSTADDHEPLLARMKDANDSVLPSPNAVSVQNLVTLTFKDQLQSYREPARQTIELFASALRDQPTSLPTMAIGLGMLLQDETSRPATTNATGENPTEASETLVALAPKDELVPAAQASAEDARKHDKIVAAVYLSVDKVPAGGECNVAVVLNVKEGWHINANPAQPKYLIPTELTAALPEKFELTDIKYPKGEEFLQQGSDEPLVVYEGKIILYGKLKAPASAAGKSASSEFTVRYQVCNDQMCLRPMKLALKGQIAIAAQGEEPQPINQSLFKPKRPQPQ